MTPAGDPCAWVKPIRPSAGVAVIGSAPWRAIEDLRVGDLGDDVLTAATAGQIRAHNTAVRESCAEEP